MKYVALASVDEWHQPAAETVYETDEMPRKTGLLDQYGRPLYRVPERQPIGFRLRS